MKFIILFLFLLSNIWMVESAMNCSAFIDTAAVSAATANGKVLQLDQAIHRCFQAFPYDTSVIPVTDGGVFHPTYLSFRFSLHSLQELENSGSLVMTTSYVFAWPDENRIWAGEGIVHPFGIVAIPVSELWYPKFVLAQCQSDNCIIQPDEGQLVYVLSFGIVILKYIKVIHTQCDMKLSKFPFDTQTCKIGFFLSDYGAFHVTMFAVNETWQFFDYSNEEWALISSTDYVKNWPARVFLRKPDGTWNRERENHTYEGIFTGFEVSLTFKRYPDYYLYNLFLPVVIISVVGLISVLLPSESSDRINMSITVLLGYIFIQSLMAALIPKVPKAPYVADYVLEAMVLSALNTVLSVIVIAIHNLKSEPPHIIKILGINVLGVIVCRCCRNCKKKNAVEAAKVSNDIEKGKTSNMPQMENNISKKSEQQQSPEDWHEVAINLGRLFSMLYAIGLVVILVKLITFLIIE